MADLQPAVEQKLKENPGKSGPSNRNATKRFYKYPLVRISFYGFIA